MSSSIRTASRHPFGRLGRLAITLLALAAVLGPGATGREQSQPEFSSREFLEPIKYLSSDKLKGRGDGTKELDEAAKYLAKRFKKYGLQPAGDNRTYLQHFRITVGAQLGPNNSVSYQSGGRQHPFLVLPGSAESFPVAPFTSK